MRLQVWLLSMCLIFAAYLSTVSAQTPVRKSGILAANEIWSNVVDVVGDVLVPAGVKLTIKANTLIRFSPGQDSEKGGYDKSLCELIIEGELDAEGKEKFEVKFTSAAEKPQSGDWYGIVFRKEETAKSKLRNCIVEFAFDGITCINASPDLYVNIIEGNFRNGVLCDIISSPQIFDNRIANNGYAGINCKINSSPTLARNEVTGNRYGILIQDVSGPNIGTEGTTSGKNLIYDNLEYNLYNHTKSIVYAQNNDWGNNLNADLGIFDDEERGKFGLVVFSPTFSSGTVLDIEFGTVSIESEAIKPAQPAAGAEVALTEVEQPGAKPTILKAAEKETKTDDKGELAAKKAAEEQDEKLKKLLEQQEQEKKRLAALEAEKKKEREHAKKLKLEELEKKKEEAKAATSTFVPVKMANELDNKPGVVNKVNPIMPPLAKKAKIRGSVLLRVKIGTDGRVLEAYVSKSIGNKDFDEIINTEALSKVKQWVFEIGVTEGNPVQYWQIVNMLFK